MSTVLTVFTWTSPALAFERAAAVALDIIFRHHQKMAIMNADRWISAVRRSAGLAGIHCHIGLRSALSPQGEKRIRARMQVSRPRPRYSN